MKLIVSVIFFLITINGSLIGDERFYKLTVVPEFTVWDVKIGSSVFDLLDTSVSDIACGTNGGPMSLTLSSFGEFFLIC